MTTAKKTKTCAGCVHLRKNPFNSAYCKKTDFIVPHSNFDKEGHFTFYRIPDSCPVEENAPYVRDKPLAKKHQDHIPFSEIPL